MRLPSPVLLSFLLGATASAPAAASTCTLPEEADPALAQVEAERRLAFVERALERAGTSAALWGSAWRATFQVASGFQVGLSQATTRYADRVDLLLGASKSTTGLLFGLVVRLPAEWHHDSFGGPRGPDARPLCVRLAEAEAQLEKDARGEARARGVVMHLLGLGLNVGVGVAAYAMHGRWWSAVLGGVLGSIVGEIRIATVPKVATEALSSYRRASFEAPAQPMAPLVVSSLGPEIGVAFAF